MVSAVIAALLITVILIIYGALMYLTDYIKITLYLKLLLINAIWFLVAEGYGDYDIYYPQVFENKWFNFLLMTAAVLLIAFETSRYVKLRNALVMSLGAGTHLVFTVLIINFCGEIPGWLAAIYIGASSLIIVAIHLFVIYKRNNTVPGNLFSRILAGILMMPAPYIIVSACLLSAKANTESVVTLVPFKEFINRLYEFLRNSKFEFKGTIMLGKVGYTRQIFITSLIAAIIVFIIYVVLDSTVDFRSEQRENRKHRKAAEKDREKAEISSKIISQIEKIDACMSYISSNYKVLKVTDADMKKLRSLYDEATRIKYSYQGAASVAILNRLNEIRTEIYVMRDHISNDIHLREERPEYENGDLLNHEKNETEQSRIRPESSTGYKQTDRADVGQSEPVQGREKETKQEKETKESESSYKAGFFNGCKTEEEIKKRYRDLCKVFHPDSGNGDPETFLKIKKDYDMLMADSQR